jgi:hypothetical protein
MTEDPTGQEEVAKAAVEGTRAKRPKRNVEEQRKEREEQQEEHDRLFTALGSLAWLSFSVTAFIGGRVAGRAFGFTVGTSFFIVGSYGIVISIFNYVKSSKLVDRIFMFGHFSISALAFGVAIVDIAVFHAGHFGVASGVFGLYLIFQACVYRYFPPSDAWSIGWIRGGSYIATLAGLSGLFDPVPVQPLAIFGLAVLTGLIVFSIAKARSTPRQISWGMFAGIGVIGAAVIGCVFVYADNLDGPFAPSMPIHGTVALVGDDGIDGIWTSLGDGTCEGAGSAGDVLQGTADVTIWRDGQLVTAVSLGAGQVSGPGCIFPFTASVRAGARGYGVQLGQRGIVRFTLDQIVHAQLTIGN